MVGPTASSSNSRWAKRTTATPSATSAGSDSFIGITGGQSGYLIRMAAQSQKLGRQRGNNR